MLQERWIHCFVQSCDKAMMEFCEMRIELSSSDLQSECNYDQCALHCNSIKATLNSGRLKKRHRWTSYRSIHFPKRVYFLCIVSWWVHDHTLNITTKCAFSAVTVGHVSNGSTKSISTTISPTVLSLTFWWNSSRLYIYSISQILVGTKLRQ